MRKEKPMKLRFTVTGLDCPNCAAKLAASIEKIEGVERASINFLTEKLIVESGREADALLPELQKCARAFSRDVKIR